MEGRHINSYSFAFADDGKDDNQDAAWHHDSDDNATV